MKIGRGFRKGCCLSSILLNFLNKYFTKEVLEGVGDFKIRGQVTHTVEYADDPVLLAKEETLLLGMIERLTEVE